ncbi:uncharacterized protein [Coffea arabica]|uniref:Uncharacterized protein n=1 Tax=Coffea arabica TaxID=13443 RepID=A0ABM4WMK1_COFAR
MSTGTCFIPNDQWSTGSACRSTITGHHRASTSFEPYQASISSASTSFQDGQILKKLKTSLLFIQAMLDIAENKQTKNPTVKEGLDALQETIYQTNDLLDQITTEALWIKIESQYQNRTIQSLGLQIGEVKKESFWLPSTSLMGETAIYGRDVNKENITNMLLSENLNENNIGYNFREKEVIQLWFANDLLEHCGENQRIEEVELPVDSEKLINLHYLNIHGTKLKKMLIQIGRLRSLQVLTTSVISKGSGSTIEELGKLPNLHGNLIISGLENVVNRKNALIANIKGKKHLESLSLKWIGYANDSQVAKYVLDNLQPRSSLKHLEIDGYCRTRFLVGLKTIASV